MKKSIITCFLSLLFLLLSVNGSFAQGENSITLKDGSQVIGKIIKLEDGIYTVETASIGEINIEQDNVLQVGPASGEITALAEEAPSEDISGLKGEAYELQKSILKDEELMSEIKLLLEDEEVKQILSDPEVMSAVLSFNPQKVSENPRIQKLLESPKMRALIEKISGKYSIKPQE
ncbi:MAG: hypothetical protein HQL27_02880 [Candidatus Omnitrophica bacterium]|nr:hypothetical protein [Candidatus Omnitrophota bacterium]